MGSAGRDRALRLANLLQNAAKFTDRGGATVVVVEADAERGEAVLRVRDTGAGMSAETLARLFVPYEQAAATVERSRTGLGLGLVVAKRMVELHGGALEARSDGPGCGAELTVRLPLLREPAPSS